MQIDAKNFFAARRYTRKTEVSKTARCVFLLLTVGIWISVVFFCYFISYYGKLNEDFLELYESIVEVSKCAQCTIENIDQV